MKFSATTVALAAALLETTSAHYFFDKLVVNGVADAGPVRTNTRETKYLPTKFKNTFDNLTPLDTDFRCNLGATNKGASKTTEVAAGSDLAMTLGVGATMQHPGPAQVYMSKAPSSAATYDGSGDWFKIHQETICNKGGDVKTDAWCTWDKDRVSFTIPSSIPDGEYLVRAEHIGLHGAHDGQAEFYYGCAQVKVTGGGNVTPTETAKIPGVYAQDDPEVNFSVWSGNTDYPVDGPGIKVFSDNSSSSSSGSGSGSSSGSGSAAGSSSSSAPSSAPSATPSSATSAAPAFTSKAANAIFKPNYASQTKTVEAPANCTKSAAVRRHAKDISV